MTRSSLQKDLARIVGPDRVLSTAADKLAYNADCWPKTIILTRGQKIQQNQPSAIVQPQNEHEIAGIVQWARKANVALVPFGAGSGVCGGAMALEEEVIVDLKRLNRVVSVNTSDHHVRVESGSIGMNLERELNRQGLTLGHYPSSLYCSTVGGYLAGRSAGQYSSRYGKIEDMVASMRVVTGTGEVLETATNPLSSRPRHLVSDCGPDLTQIFVGSEGTLGMITQASLRIDKLPTHRVYRGFQFPDVPTGLLAIRKMMQAGLMPDVVRLYDEIDSLLARTKKGSTGSSRSIPARLAAMAADVLPVSVSTHLKDRVSDVSKAFLSRVLGQPITLNALLDAIPSHCLLIVGFEGMESTWVEEQSRQAFDILEVYGVDLGSEPGRRWYEHRMSVSYKQSAMFDAGAFVDTMEVSTTWSNLARLYEAVRRALAPHVLVMAHFSHVYPEGSSIYFTFAGFGADTDDTIRRYEETWRAGLDAVKKNGGSIAHHHGVGVSKAAYTHSDHSGGPLYFRALKETFDPDRVLNPGKVYPQESLV